MKVIGVGFGRTGTLSLYAALEFLGYRCYHMKEAIENELSGKQDLTRWLKFADCSANRSAEDLKEMVASHQLDQYTAAVDFPCCAVYKQLAALYPNAKFVFTKRDPEKWVDSMINAVYLSEDIFNIPVIGSIVKFCARFWLALPFMPNILTAIPRYAFVARGLAFDGVFYRGRDPREYSFHTAKGRANAIETYHKWEAEVKRSVPKDRLLEFDVKTDGWEKLCKFLGQPLVQGPFPHVNDRDSIRSANLTIGFLLSFPALATVLCSVLVATGNTVFVVGFLALVFLLKLLVDGLLNQMNQSVAKSHSKVKKKD